ncbi:MAG: hypothetical protein U0931_04990 [Vulcanimicrobiota bacterium]
MSQLRLGGAATIQTGFFRFDAIGQLLENIPCREGSIEGIPWLEKRARLFVAGSYKIGDKTLTYAEAQLDKMAASIRPRMDGDPSWDVPVQLDHSWSASESVGNVRSAERIGQELWGWLRFVGQAEVDNVKSRKWLKLSIQHDSLYNLVEVSVTPFPRVLTARIYAQNPQPEPDYREGIRAAIIIAMQLASTSDVDESLGDQQVRSAISEAWTRLLHSLQQTVSPDPAVAGAVEEWKRRLPILQGIADTIRAAEEDLRSGRLTGAECCQKLQATLDMLFLRLHWKDDLREISVLKFADGRLDLTRAFEERQLAMGRSWAQGGGVRRAR